MRAAIATALLLGAIANVAAAPRPLAVGQIGADVSLAIGLDKAHAFETISLSPDLWIGVGHDVTVGITHSDASVDRIGAGSSICVRRVHEAYPQPCDRAYHGAALDVRWDTRVGPLEVSPRARVMLRDVDPDKPAATLGAIVAWTHGRFVIWGDPYLRVGLANTALGNRTTLVLPVYLGVHAAGWLLALHTGYDADLAVASDGFHVPIALRVTRELSAHTALTLEAGFSSALGPLNSVGFRAAIFTLAWRS
ncbi:MAG: hypothetical protein NT062_07170 [Proteobacteria bacterium]|nr:hypothetical protein [Pseudomonadota bacterium]